MLAVILTYSAPEALVTCVRAVLGQSRPPDQVLVVDNAGVPSATEALASAGLDEGGRVRVLRTGSNTGPAGGHAAGLAELLASPSDLAWVLDDDCVPTPGCLAALIEDSGHESRGVYLFPTWVDPGGHVVRYPAWCGFVVSRDVIERVGLPRADLFWWGEDTELLLWRIPGAGYPYRRSDRAVVHHTRIRATRHRPAWKYYYEARNTVFLRIRHRRHPEWIPRIVAKLIAIVVLREDQRATKLAMIARGVGDGLLGRLGVRVPVPAPRPPGVTQVVHVLPLDLARGAQTYARELRLRLDRPGTEHRTLTLFSSEPVALFPDASLAVPPGWWRRVGLDPRVALRLRRRLRATAPDVVVAHGGEPLLYLALACPHGTRLIYYRVGIVTERMRNPLRRRLYRWAVGRAALVAGVSEETLDDARSLFGVPGSRLRLLPNGREPASGGTDGRTEPPSGASARLVWVGHLSEGKRPERFVDVVRALGHRGVDVTAWLVGDGPLGPALQRSATGGGVEVLGRRDDVAALMAAADVFCFTSDGTSEGMPGVLIEAGLAGLPVVATRVAGAGTVIDDGVTGLLVDPDDLDGFVDAVARLVVDAPLRLGMGAAARRRCSERFTLEASVAGWQAVLDELLS